jgi:hypothetical protein
MTPVIAAFECSPDEGRGSRAICVCAGRSAGVRRCFGPLVRKQRFVSLNDGDRL